MKKFKVTATKDVGYAAIIEAENEDEAWAIARGDRISDPDWVQTDDGHDWTLEDVWELEDDDLQEIPPHEEFKVSQAANNDVSTDIDGLTKEEVEAIDEKIRKWELEFHPLDATQRIFMRMHEAHHLKFKKGVKTMEIIKAVGDIMKEAPAIAGVIECEQGQMGAGKNKLYDQILDERIVEYVKTNDPKHVPVQKHKPNPPRNPFASETQSIKGHKSRK